jgi:PAS domain S-box-containing protein
MSALFESSASYHGDCCPPDTLPAQAIPRRPLAPSLPGGDASPWNDRLTLLLESTGEGIFGIDLEGRCTFINHAGADMLGYAAGQVLGRNMHYLIHHTHRDGRHYPVDECPIFRAFWQGLPCRIDSEVFWRADGSCFPAEYSSHPIIENGVMLGAVVTLVDISERKRAEELLRQANDQLERRVEERTGELTAALQQLRELSAYLHTVREEERTRIAREIHDELGSLLVALKMDVNWMVKRLDGNPDLDRKCRSMGRLIEGAVDNVGRIITDLRPSILDHQGLWAALEWQAQEFAEKAELACDSRLELAPETPAPEGALAIAVFRIFQEMLSNVARHSQATTAAIRIATCDGMLTIEVADNGCGAAATAFASPRAYGVLGMRERAGHFGGELTIASQPGAGTTVRLRIPLQEAGAALTA